MAEEIKKFYRSRKDRILFGVCGGLGDYFGIDPILFRLLFVMLFLLNGIGILLYAIVVFTTSSAPRVAGEKKDLEGELNELAGKIDKKAQEIAGEIKPAEAKASGHNMLGLLVILFGLFFLAREFFPMGWIDSNMIWSLAIIGIGFYIIFKK